MSMAALRPFLPLAFGVLVSALATTLYYFFGYGYDVLLLWACGIAAGGYYFFSLRSPKERLIEFGKRDVLFLLGLLALFLPVYLWNIYEAPWQVNTDEIATMVFERDLVLKGERDVFGLSGYFDYPNAMFLFRGWLSRPIGGVNLFTMRLISGLIGILVILCSYFFFRVLFSSEWLAFGGAVLAGSNHALIAISRMAMNSNAPLLFAFAAFTLLVLGVRKRSDFALFAGGALSGLAFYHYFPGRAIILIWLLCFTALAMFFRSSYDLRLILRWTTVSLIGFFMAALPILIATYKAPNFGAEYGRHQILIYPEAQELQRTWNGSSTAYEGMYRNALNGLLTFNRNLHDHGYEYPNYGHGFVDPLTGILIWAGILTILFKTQKEEKDIFILLGFFFLYFFFALLTTKNPHYTRLLIVIPFVSALSLYAVALCARAINKSVPAAGLFVFFAAVFYVFAANVEIFSDFAREGKNLGNDVGSTARYIEARKDKPGYSFYVAASAAYPYYSWGNERQWQTWAGFFTGPDQQVKIAPPEAVADIPKTTPFTIFASREALSLFEEEIRRAYPHAARYDIKTEGSLAALEVL